MKIIAKKCSKILILQAVQVFLSYLLLGLSFNFFVVLFFDWRLLFSLKDILPLAVREILASLNYPNGTQVNWLDDLMCCFN